MAATRFQIVPVKTVSTSLSAIESEIVQADFRHLKSMSCYFVMLGVTLLWLITLAKYAHRPGYIPWCATFSVASFMLAVKLFSGQVNRLRPVISLSPGGSTSALTQTITSIYASTSLVLLLAFFQTHFLVVDTNAMREQVIDIELMSQGTSLSDAATNTSPWPVFHHPHREHILQAHQRTALRQAVASDGPRPAIPHKQLVHKHIASIHNQIAPIHKHIASIHNQIAPIHKPIASIHNQIAPIHKPIASIHNQIAPIHKPIASVPLPARPLAAVKNKATVANRNYPPGSSFFMEEVPPTQLVEVLNTDDTPPIASHPKSSAESPATVNMLAQYMKQLHKIIKDAWSPPRGDTMSTEILFRIRRSGELALVKVLRSSGNPNSDEAAIDAITASAPLPPLPKSFTLASLDVDYTFNYTADKLTEITARSYH